MNDWHFSQAAQALKAGGVIAYPTEAVWGLGCDPFNESAFNQLLELKHRPKHKGVILIAGCLEHIDFLLAPLSSEQLSMLQETWPGPVTWLLPDLDDSVPAWIKGEHGSVAVRVSNHFGVKSLCNAFGGALVSTSANIAGRDPAKNESEVSAYFDAGLSYCLPGNVGDLDRPTQIRDLQTNQVIRA